MRTGPDRFNRLLLRTERQLADATNLPLEATSGALSGLRLEHEVVLRRWAPRLHSLREMGACLDAVDIDWPRVHVPGSGWVTVKEAVAILERPVRYTSP
jgi:hypothetical protein